MLIFLANEHLVHFLVKHHTSGGIAFEESAFFKISSGIARLKVISFNQSINSDVEGFLLKTWNFS